VTGPDSYAAAALAVTVTVLNKRRGSKDSNNIT
jgi:hypothetical protein